MLINVLDRLVNVEKKCANGVSHDVFEADRSAVSVGVSLLRSGLQPGDFRCRRP